MKIAYLVVYLAFNSTGTFRFKVFYDVQAACSEMSEKFKAGATEYINDDMPLLLIEANISPFKPRITFKERHCAVKNPAPQYEIFDYKP